MIEHQRWLRRQQEDIRFRRLNLSGWAGTRSRVSVMWFDGLFAYPNPGRPFNPADTDEGRLEK